MKLIKEIIYKTVAPVPLGITDMDTYLKDNRFTTTPINFYYEVGETDEIVIFMNVYEYPYDESDGDDEECGRVYQVETAVLDKRDSELVYMRDNDGFSKVNHLSHLPIWSHDTLKSMVTGIRDTNNGDNYGVGYCNYLTREDIRNIGFNY